MCEHHEHVDEAISLIIPARPCSLHHLTPSNHISIDPRYRAFFLKKKIPL